MSICLKLIDTLQVFLDCFNNSYIEFGDKFEQIHGVSLFNSKNCSHQRPRKISPVTMATGNYL